MSRRLIPLAPIALAALLLGTGCSPAGAPTAAPSAADSLVVARVSGAPITQAELDRWIRDQLFEERVGSQPASKQYEYRAQALEALIDERLLEAVAASRGIPPEQVIEQEVAKLGAVDDAEVAEFFERHRTRFRAEDTLEERAEQIHRFLQNERQDRALSGLRETASVEIALAAPRIAVTSVGPAKGPDDAAVTIIEFSDYQCPFCSRAEPVVAELLERYPQQVRFVFRHLPLDSIHPRARAAAEAAVCAEEQGRFWEFHEQLFANQRALSDEDLTGYAEGLGLDLEGFAACRTAATTRDRVQADVDAARDAGATGTPAFFVNGILLSGARPVEDFVELIERELAQPAASG